MIARTSPGTFFQGLGLSLAVTLCCIATPAVQAEDPAGHAFFEKNIRPVLATHCYECHSASRTEANLRLDVPEALLAGGQSGPAIEPGEPGGSLLLSALRHEDLKMPPDGRLPDHVIADFEVWIAMGAPDPRDADSDKSAQVDSYSEKELWSLQPVRNPEVPEVEDAHWPRSAIDHFILSRLERQGLTPNADADRWTLVRRVYFDLTGLPPTPEQAESFVRDDSPEALENLVDRLLGSPQFGEKWARHWLDVARYAESSGREFNFTYPHAWPYRDYVIAAFNADKPYDQFLREQIAGDLMAEHVEEQDWQRRDELHAATAFLAVGSKRHEAGREFRMEVADDQIDVTTQAVLGLAVSCARCHDHKYDPIPTSDYYAMAGIFKSTLVLDGTTDQQYSRYPTDPIPMGPNGRQKHEAAEKHAQQVTQLSEKLDEAKEQLEAAREALEKSEQAAEAEAEPSREAETLAPLEDKVASLEQDLEQKQASAPPRPPYTMGVKDRAEVDDTRIAVGGDLGTRGDLVPRGVLGAIQIDSVPDVPPDESGRMQLALWLSSEENPLTARVMVNRVWSHLFGQGIVRTVDNFGALGDQPTHPELLDYLAAQFMDDGWSVKQLIRKLVLSRTYALSTQYDGVSHAADPENELLWRMPPRRLQVEQLRDAMLAVSDQLDLTPAEGSPITVLGNQLTRNIDQQQMTPPSSRRSVYQPVVRDYLPEMFQLFDFAAPSLVIGRRAETTVPAQALYLLNSDFALDQAEQLARRVLQDDTLTDPQRADLAYRLVLRRPATAEERTEAKAFIDMARQQDDLGAVDAWAALCHVLLASAEFRYLVDVPIPVRHIK